MAGSTKGGSKRIKRKDCLDGEYSRWDFEPEDYVVVGHREVTDKEKKEAEELLKRAF